MQTDAPMNESYHQMELSLLASRCADALRLRRLKETFNELFCLEIFRRAMLYQNEPAWEVLQQRFHETVRIWLYKHPYADVALHRDSEQNYIALTFSRFWQAVHDQSMEFSNLRAALSYLHATLGGLLTDAMRLYLRARDLEAQMPEPGSLDEPANEDLALEISVDQNALWESICNILPDQRERRLVYLLYYCGLKPREIVVRCPLEFSNIQEIYRMSHNILERLRRNRERFRSFLGEEIEP